MLEAVARCVSVIVPCRNERAHIEAFCDGVMRQALPEGWTLQLLIADGMSDDGTRELLARITEADPRIELVANPQRIVSSGLNRALEGVRGEVIVRMDVHTEYAPDYIAECLVAISASGADNVGGPWQARPVPSGGAMQRAVAAAFQSRWVTGGALSRRLDYEGWVDTVYLGCWPRATFERFGGFDENLVRNQDDEHNLRIVQGGGRVWQSSRVHSVYRPRARLGQVLRQHLQYGYWKPFVMKKHKQVASARQLVPGVFVAMLIVFIVAALLGGPVGPALALAAAYAGVVAAMTWLVARSAKLDAAATMRVPAVIASYHIGYGIGSLLGGFDAMLSRKGRALFASLSR
ncbi:hypothetical protein BH11PSE8_BH11PSE8_17830 [soil metagenome]